MKTSQTTLIITTLLFWGATWGQEISQKSKENPITEIIIDLNNDQGIDPAQIDKYNTLKKGEFFRLRIENLNTYLYEVSVTNEDIDQTSPLPEGLLDLVDYGGLKSSLGNLSSVSGVVKQFVALETNDGLQNVGPDHIRSAENLKNYFAGIKSDYKSIYSSLDGWYTEVDALFGRAENYQNTITTVERNVLGSIPSKEDIKTDLTSFDTTKAGVITIKEGLIQKNTQFLTVIEANQATIAETRELKQSSAEIKKVYETLLKASDQLIAQLSAKNYASFSAVLIGILNNLDFSYTTLPIQRYSDVNELMITLKPRDKNAKLSGYSTVLRIPDIEQSFWGLSTGFYLTHNPQHTYSIVERVENAQTLYDFLEEDSANVELGINTMVRYGLRLGEILDTPSFWHFGFGAGLSIDQKFKPRLMAGTGLAFGSKNKLFIDVGGVYMYYDTLSKAYTLKGNTVLPENFLVNATQINAYVSLGYLIGL